MFKLVHILTDPEAEREKASIASLSGIVDYGIEYVQEINQPYDGEDWKLVKNWAHDIYPNHGSRHYGAFTSFKQGVLKNFTEDLDALILCECDCVLSVTLAEFSEQIKKSYDFVKDNQLSYYTFGYPSSGMPEFSPKHAEDPKHPHSYITDKIICAHCVMLPSHERDFIRSEISSRPWETPDVWFNMVFHTRGPSKFGAMNQGIAFQHEGFSMIDQRWK